MAKFNAAALFYFWVIANTGTFNVIGYTCTFPVSLTSNLNVSKES